MPRTNVRLSGFGGQGIILAGVTLARAAVEHDGINAAQTQSYGAESRGGACMASVVLDEEQIDFPMPEYLDVLVAMSQSALDRHLDDLLPEGTLIVDSDTVASVPDRPSGAVYRIPATRIATETLSQRMVANMVMLGATARLTGVVSIDGVTAAMEGSVPEHTVDVNRRAIEAGVALAEKLVG